MIQNAAVDDPAHSGGVCLPGRVSSFIPIQPPPAPKSDGGHEQPAYARPSASLPCRARRLPRPSNIRAVTARAAALRTQRFGRTRRAVTAAALAAWPPQNDPRPPTLHHPTGIKNAIRTTEAATHLRPYWPLPAFALTIPPDHGGLIFPTPPS